MLYAQVDAIVSHIGWMGFLGIEVRVSKTGWPSKGDPSQIAATSEYAATYNRNVLVPWFFFLIHFWSSHRTSTF
jgi:exo-beta-1,3-glucanase (GH17 family)